MERSGKSTVQSMMTTEPRTSSGLVLAKALVTLMPTVRVPSLRAGKIKLATHKSERKDPRIHMSERPSFWQRLFGRTGSSSLSPRQQKVSDYIISRMEDDVPLQEVIREDYVRRNCSNAEVEKIVSTPEFIETARQRLGESFKSEEFRL
jgi:hypothetical protein